MTSRSGGLSKKSIFGMDIFCAKCVFLSSLSCANAFLVGKEAKAGREKFSRGANVEGFPKRDVDSRAIRWMRIAFLRSNARFDGRAGVDVARFFRRFARSRGRPPFFLSPGFLFFSSRKRSHIIMYHHRDADQTTFLLFLSKQQINDISLEDYIAVKPKYATFVPHTAGRYAAKRFRKAQCPIVERIVNSLMMHGRNNGKKLMAARIVRHAMDIIFLLTDQNPLQVVVDAVINAGPREDATRVGSAGVVRRQAVDISPLRRVNDAIYLLTTGAREAAFRNVKTMAECLADELVNAAKGSSNSYAIKKKDELERVAKANR